MWVLFFLTNVFTSPNTITVKLGFIQIVFLQEKVNSSFDGFLDCRHENHAKNIIYDIVNKAFKINLQYKKIIISYNKCKIKNKTVNL